MKSKKSPVESRLRKVGEVGLYRFLTIGFSALNFGKPGKEVIKVAELSDGLNIAELFHGPTLAFKDLTLGVVAQLVDYFLEKRQQHNIILIGKMLPLKF